MDMQPQKHSMLNTKYTYAEELLWRPARGHGKNGEEILFNRDCVQSTDGLLHIYVCWQVSIGTEP